MVAAFAGWPDAHEGASYAVRYLIRELKAERIAEIDPEVYYDFTQVRPVTRMNEQGERSITWPTNEFYYRASDETLSKDLVFFVGIEPNLRWRSFTSALMHVIQECGVKMVISLGALLDAVPHTREVKVTGSSPDRKLRRGLGLRGSTYQGPTGITSALMEACQRAEIPFASIWGHSPHYLQVVQNPKVSYALLTRLNEILGTDFELDNLRSSGATFEKELQDVMAQNTDLNSYINRLEQDYDSSFSVQTPQEMPSPEAIVQELEEFLRQQRPQSPSD